MIKEKTTNIYQLITTNELCAVSFIMKQRFFTNLTMIAVGNLLQDCSSSLSVSQLLQCMVTVYHSNSVHIDWLLGPS